MYWQAEIMEGFLVFVNFSLSRTSHLRFLLFLFKVHILSEVLHKQGMRNVKVQSVTASQGAECDFAVLSTVVAPADTSSATVRRYVSCFKGTDTALVVC